MRVQARAKVDGEHTCARELQPGRRRTSRPLGETVSENLRDASRKLMMGQTKTGPGAS